MHDVRTRSKDDVLVAASGTQGLLASNNLAGFPRWRVVRVHGKDAQVAGRRQGGGGENEEQVEPEMGGRGHTCRRRRRCRRRARRRKRTLRGTLAPGRFCREHGFAPDQPDAVQGGGPRLRFAYRSAAAAGRLGACARRPGAHRADPCRACRCDRDRALADCPRRADRSAVAQRQHRSVRGGRGRQDRDRYDAPGRECERQHPRAQRPVAARRRRLQFRRPDGVATARARC